MSDTRRPLSPECRARIIADSTGMVSTGDYKKRVYETALEQIRASEAVIIMRLQAQSRFEPAEEPVD